MARNYSNIAVDTTLAAGIGAGDLSLTVASATGWPAAPFAAVLDPGAATEEVVQVTVAAGTLWTITRGFDGTTAAAHALGVTVRHAAIAGDFTDLQAADTSEAATRAAADTALSNSIASEANTRATADLLRLLASNNLSDLANAGTARTNLGLGALAVLNSITASLISDASANGRSLITAADYAAMRILLSLVIGTNVQAWDADLDAIAALASAADKLPYATGPQAWAMTTLTSFMRTLLDDTDAATARATLGAQIALSESRFKLGGTPNWSIPGVVPISTSTNVTAANFLFYAPILVLSQISVDQLACEVTTSSAGWLARIGIYNADSDWQPTSLIVDSGDLDCSSNGVKTASISQTLSPGRYLSVMTNNNSGIGFRRIHGGNNLSGLLPALGASPFITRGAVARSYAALPGTGTAYTAQNNSSTPGVEHYVFYRVSTP